LIFFYEISLRNSTLKSGDILITNATSKNGITGHAGLVLDANEILHIQGAGYNPVVDTKARFIHRYKNGWIKVYRPSNTSMGESAANWADKKYRNSGALYGINLDLNRTDLTYCSKIVWQSYFFGVGRKSILNSNKSRLIRPYNLKFEIRNLKFAGNVSN